MVIEKLLHAFGKVEAVFLLAETVTFAVVVQHPSGLGETSHSYKQLNPLVPRHGAVAVVVQDEQGGLNVVGKEHR